MKFYVAFKWEDKLRTEKVLEKLKENGREKLDPFEEHFEQAQKLIEKDILAARNCDVFILLSNKVSRGSHAEFGAALAENLAAECPEIFVVG